MSGALKPHARQVLAIARRLGVQNAAIEHRSAHMMLTGRGRGGASVRVCIASTPSDWRALRNTRAEIKRQACGRAPRRRWEVEDRA